MFTACWVLMPGTAPTAVTNLAKFGCKCFVLVVAMLRIYKAMLTKGSLKANFFIRVYGAFQTGEYSGSWFQKFVAW